MDWISQAALGALIGELVMGKRLGKRALAWGAFFGILPGLDVILFPLLDTARELAWHRGPSHSLIIMAAGSWAMAQGLVKLWRREKISKARAGGFVFAAWAAHVLVECLTVEGAAVLWPFSGNRLGLNLLPRTDFMFSGALIVTAIWLAFLPNIIAKRTRGKKSEPLPKRVQICARGLLVAAGYVLIAVAMKQVASAGFDADLARRGIEPMRRMESPMPYNILLWRSVVDRGEEFWVGYRTVFERHDTPVRWTVYLRGRENIAAIRERRETMTVARFTNGWWIARAHAKGAWLGDLREPELRVWGSKKSMVDSRLASSWLINPAEKDDALRKLFPEKGKSGEYLRRMGNRIIGDRSAWEENPRLAGVPGSLPEFLPVEE